MWLQDNKVELAIRPLVCGASFSDGAWDTNILAFLPWDIYDWHAAVWYVLMVIKGLFLKKLMLYMFSLHQKFATHVYNFVGKMANRTHDMGMDRAQGSRVCIVEYTMMSSYIYHSTCVSCLQI